MATINGGEFKSAKFINTTDKIKKTLSNTTTGESFTNVADLKKVGMNWFHVVSKAWSESEKWMKTTKAASIPGNGVVIQITTQQNGNIAEAALYIKGCKMVENKAYAPYVEIVPMGMIERIVHSVRINSRYIKGWFFRGERE